MRLRLLSKRVQQPLRIDAMLGWGQCDTVGNVSALVCFAAAVAVCFATGLGADGVRIRCKCCRTVTVCWREHVGCCR